MGTSKMTPLEFWSLKTSNANKMLDARDMSELAAGRMILFDTILQSSNEGFGLINSVNYAKRIRDKPRKDEILEAICVYKALNYLIGEDDIDFYMSDSFNEGRVTRIEKGGGVDENRDF